MGSSEHQHAVAAANTPAEKPPCTALCLWEPDAALMIRKAQGQERARRSEYAAANRKGEAQALAGESGVSEEIRAFEEFFALELRAARDTMEQVAALEAHDKETPKLFDWWHEQLIELHGYVAGATSYLPTQLRQQFGKAIADHEAKLKSERERLAPRKKFGFKNRSKVDKKTAGKEAAAAAPQAGDTFQAPSGCAGFRSRTGEKLVRLPADAAGAASDASAVDGAEQTTAAGDFALENLQDCDVRLFSSSAVLWIRGLRNCTVFALPVQNSIYVTDVSDCTLYLGSRQLRIHTSHRVGFYVHTASRPIFEHCNALTFAPYPTLPPSLASTAFTAVGLSATPNENWRSVDDFDWLKASHSPNWSELGEEARVAPAALAAEALLATDGAAAVDVC